MLKALTAARSLLFRRNERAPDLGSQLEELLSEVWRQEAFEREHPFYLRRHSTDLEPLAALSPEVTVVNTPGAMTVPELERLKGDGHARERKDGGVTNPDRGVDAISPYFKAVAIDFDGTLAEGGAPSSSVLAAVRSARDLGLRLLLVTGRTLTDLGQVFPDVHEHFDLTVAENGAILRAAEGHRRLARPVDPELAKALQEHGISAQSGEVILACDAVHDAEVFEEIRRLDLDCQLIRNRGALMVVPAGVTKASGLGAGLRELGLSAHSAMAIGDAENDLAMLESCELGVAVANAVPVVRQRADLVLEHCDGLGVTAFLNGPIVRGKQFIHPERWRIRLGMFDDGEPATLPSSQINILVTGASQSGKSYLAGLITEQLIRHRYSVLVIDPEGDHVRLGELPDVLVVGGREGLPTPERLANLLGLRLGSVVADLSFLSRDDANRYVREVAPRVERQRLQKGAPHWIVVDEAHGTLGLGGAVAQYLAPGATGYLLVTYRPWELSGDALEGVDAMIAVAGGQQLGISNIAKVIAGFAGEDPAGVMARMEGAGPERAMLASRDGGTRTLQVGRRTTSHVRHWHKYATVEQPVQSRFYFRRGPGEGIVAIAGNLQEFHRELSHCDAAVVVHHAMRHDFSRWIQGVFRDSVLAATIEVIEAEAAATRASSNSIRNELLSTIEARYLE
jgi:hydroxymethylpyrimidine pyrophosphatase-like HAD family hydrolase